MKRLFPNKNDCAELAAMEEVFNELYVFSIQNKLQLRIFLKKYRRQLLAIDQMPLDNFHQKFYREDLGDKEYNDRIWRQYWFCYPALIRTALEIEFGDSYVKFSNERDKL